MESTNNKEQRKLPELLAPAGSINSFIAAVESGADAIYLGAKDFSARQYAENFSDKDLESAVEYAHIRGVNVYLAVNTLVFEDELSKALETIYKACCTNIDAIIVQDIGVASKVIEIFPEIGLHASTQMTVHNFEGVNLLKKMGFKRIVLSRELTLTQISDIVQRAKDIELEIFVHGALCVSYSGQCLFSSMVGGRSGNRGRCAQPCRQKYKLINWNNGQEVYNGELGDYLLSTKDLCTIDLLSDIVESGVHSLKIEGRMKSPEYVATVTQTYRKYLDAIRAGHKMEVKKEDIDNLQLVFNRGGFTKGLLGGEKGNSLMSMETPSHRGIEGGRVIEFDNKKRIVKIKLSTNIKHGDVIKLSPGDEESTTVTKILINGEKVESGKTEDIVEILTKQSWRKGDLVYKVYDKKLIQKASLPYSSGKLLKKVPLIAEFSLSYGNPIELALVDEDGNKVKVRGKRAAEEAQKVKLIPEKVLEQLESMGNTPFYLEKTEIQMDDQLFLPLSEINDTRRKAIEEIIKERIKRREKKCEKEKVFKGKLTNLFKDSDRQIIKKSPKISVVLPNFELLLKIKNLDFARVYIPWNQLFEDKIIPSVIEKITLKGKEVFIAFPRITMKSEMEHIYNNIKKIENYGFSGALIGNYGLIKMFKILKDFKIQADYSFNFINRFTVQALENMGVNGAILSPELELKQIENIIDSNRFDTEIFVHGRIPLMIGKYCPIRSVLQDQNKNENPCYICKKNSYGLKDRTGVIFPMEFNPGQCHFEVLNSKVLCLAWDFEEVRKLNSKFFRINITNEDERNIPDILDLYSKLIENDTKVLEKYKQLLEKVKMEGFTRGHYFRGVE